MELPLVLGVASSREPAAEAPALRAALRGVLEDVRGRFSDAPWRVLTSGEGDRSKAAKTMAEEAGCRVLTLPPGSSQALLSEASHLLVLVGSDTDLDRLAAFRLTSAPPPGEQASLDPPTRGPVVRIARGASGWSASWADPQEPARKKGAPAHEKVWRRVEAFNRDVARLPDRPLHGLLPVPDADALGPEDKAVMAAYEAADALATQLQRSSRHALASLLLLAVLATLLLQLGTLAGADRRVTGALYVLALTGAWLVWLWAKKRDFRAKQLDARALAEGLRVQLFWRLAGLGESAADHYLRKQRSELDWIRHAIRAVDLEASSSRRPPSPDAVQTSWLESQARWYAGAAKRNETDDRRVHRASAVLFGVALALAFSKPFLDTAHPLVVLVGLIPATAAFVKWWSERRAFGPLARQYERMAVLFDAAARENARALEAGRTESSRRILLEAGREALAENGDWVLLHRERPVRVPGM